MEKVIPTVPLRRWPAASFATPLNLIRRGTGSAGTTWDGEDTICPAACGSAATAVVAALFGAAGSCADRAGVGRRKNKLDTKTPRERMQMFIRSPTQIGAKWKHEGARRVNEEMGHSLMCGDRQEPQGKATPNLNCCKIASLTMSAITQTTLRTAGTQVKLPCRVYAGGCVGVGSESPSR